MNYTESGILLGVAALGFLIGMLHFGLLQLTLRKVLGVKRLPWVWLVGSFVLRIGIVVGAFLWAAKGDPIRMLCVLVGFLMARTYLIRKYGQPSRPRKSGPGKSVNAY